LKILYFPRPSLGPRTGQWAAEAFLRPPSRFFLLATVALA
jgi:hypothetical protein